MNHEFDDDRLAAELRRLNERALSTRERMFHVLLLLVATAMTVVLAALLLTEPALPARTAFAFWVMTGMGLAWMAYAAWVLARRRTLQLRHRVRAGQMAVAFTTIFAAAAWIIAWATEDRTAYLAAGVGTLLWAVAWIPLGRAQQRVKELEQRKQTLQQRLQNRRSS